MIVIHLLLSLSIIFYGLPLQAAAGASSASTSKNLAQQNFMNATDMLFAPYQAHINSLNEQFIDQTFDQGLKLDKKTIRMIKNFYWYLEYVVKLEISLKTKKSQDKITVSAEKLSSSDCWQNFIKYSITQLFDAMDQPINNVVAAEKSMFKYIPDLQTAIHNQDCMGLWNMSSYIRHQLELYNVMITRLITQCKDWQKYNLSQAYDAAKTFKSSDYYKTTQINYFQTINGKLVFKQTVVPSPMREYMVVLSMIHALQEACKSIFNPDQVTDTVKALARTRVSPIFLIQSADDYIYLDFLANKHQKIKQNAQPGAAPSTDENEDLNISAMPMIDETVIVQDFLSDAGDFFKKTGDEIVQGGKDTWEGVKKAGTNAYYATRDGIVGLGTGNTELMMKASRELDQAGNGIIDTVDGLNEVAKGVVKGAVGSIVLPILGSDPELSKNILGSIDTAVDAVMDSITKLAEGMWVQSTIFFAELGAEAIAATAGAINIAVSAAIDGKYSQIPDLLKNQYKELGNRVTATILNTVSFYANAAKEVMTDTMLCIAYMSAAIVDILIDVVHGVATVIEVFTHPGESLPDAWEKASQSSATQWMQDHRRSWEAGVNLGLTIGLTVATGGGALVIIGVSLLNSAFSLGTIVGAAQQDEESIQLKKEQEDFINRYRGFVNDSKLLVPAIQTAMTNELQKKYNAEVSNMERSLGFYQDYLSSNYLISKNQYANSLGQYQLAFITPDPSTGAIPADPGSIYGFRTGFLDLNPGQGFSLYSKARSTLSQEIAEAPELVQLSDGTSQPKFWFNQKLVKQLDKDAKAMLDVELTWQVIYTLNIYYVGLYVGGKIIDISDLQKTKQANVESSMLAKMLVYKQELGQTKPTFGIYEHESNHPDFTKNNGWYSGSTIKVPQFNLGTLYHMKVQLDGAQLRLKLWDDQNGKEPSDWQTISVSPVDQLTVGVIYSGASMQFDFIKPEDTISIIPQIRPPYQGQDEKNRELQAQVTRSRIENPKFGSFTLTSLGSTYLANNQYIYVTQNTKLTDQSVNPANDYVLFATVQQDSISNIGSAPQTSANALVSLVTGNAYDTSGKILGTYSNILSLFQQTYGALDATFLQTLDAQKTAYANSLKGPFTFGSFTLNASGVDDIKAGLYIYLTNTPEMADAQGNPIQDYVVMAQLNNQNFPIKVGIPFDTKTTNGFISLVTGNVYNATSSHAVGSGYTNVYTMYSSKLTPTLLAAIAKAQIAYKSVPVKPTTPPPTPTTQQPQTPFAAKEDLAPNETQVSQAQGFGGSISTLPPAQKSLSDQQKSAAGSSQTNFGFDMSGGF